MIELELQRYSFRKLIILLSALFCLVLLLNSIAADFGYHYQKDYGSRVEINIKDSEAADGRTIKLKNIQAIINYPLENVSYMNEAETYLKAGNSGYAVKAVLCGENLADFLDINILKGTFLSKSQHEYGKNVAVISDTLAQKLFMTHNVLENEVAISGVTYKITGIYKSENSPFSILSSDGAERVYIPFESISDYKSQTISTVFIKDKRLQEETFRTNKVEDLLKKMGVESSYYKIKDFYNSSIYVSQPLSVFIFFIGILILFILLKYFIRYIKAGMAFFRNRMEGRYFIEVITGSKLRLILFFSGALLLSVSMVGVYYAIRFKGSVPYQYIPPENIFDFGFYGNLIVAAVNNANGYAGYIPTQYELLFRNNLVIVVFMIICLVINFILVKSEIKLYQIVTDSITKSLAVLALSMAVGAAAGAVLCWLCGIQISFPVRYTAILCIYFSLKLPGLNKILDLRFSERQ